MNAGQSQGQAAQGDALRVGQSRVEGQVEGLRGHKHQQGPDQRIDPAAALAPGDVGGPQAQPDFGVHKQVQARAQHAVFIRHANQAQIRGEEVGGHDILIRLAVGRVFAGAEQRVPGDMFQGLGKGPGANGAAVGLHKVSDGQGYRHRHRDNRQGRAHGDEFQAIAVRDQQRVQHSGQQHGGQGRAEQHDAPDKRRHSDAQQRARPGHGAAALHQQGQPAE